MKGRILRYVILALLALACAAGAWSLQPRTATAGETQSEMIVAGLGGFRGLIAEVIWFRADRLQEEGRYAELAQLATTLTMLEPHTPDVWAYAAWNLAYNVSVMMPDAPERWRWVEAGIRLLRDDGLRLNPGDPAIYRELAWMFLAKIGGDIDSAAPHYREQWKRRVEEARRTGGWDALKLDPVRMKAVDAEYGAQDWTRPLASALYWADAGLGCATRREDRRELRQIAWQALMLLAKNATVTIAHSRTKDLRAVCRRHGMRLVGPNCFGVASLTEDVRLQATFAANPPLPGRAGRSLKKVYFANSGML